MTRITMTTALAAFTITLAPMAQAYGTQPEDVAAPSETCALTSAELAALLNLPEGTTPSC